MKRTELPLSVLVSLAHDSLADAISERFTISDERLRDAALEVELFADNVLGVASHSARGGALPAQAARDLREAELILADDVMADFAHSLRTCRRQMVCVCVMEYLRVRLLAESPHNAS